MEMDLRIIEMFQEVMIRGSVTAAAKAIGVTQPAVSTALAKLEERVGFPLFRRVGRHLEPTPEARLFSAESARALNGFENLAAVAAGISASTRGSLTIAANPASSISWLPRIVAEFQQSRPDTRVRFISRMSHEIRRLSDGDAFDIGLAEAPFTRQDSVDRRYHFAMLAVLHPESALLRHKILTPRLIAKDRLIMVSGALWTDAAITRAFEEAGVNMPVTAQCDYVATALGMVINGAGICLADPISVADFEGRGLSARPFKPAIDYEVGVLRPARGEFSRLAKAFLELLDKRLSRFAR
jgi:DNA-binding transcriptional LysR family regulator